MICCRSVATPPVANRLLIAACWVTSRTTVIGGLTELPIAVFRVRSVVLYDTNADA